MKERRYSEEPTEFHTDLEDPFTQDLVQRIRQATTDFTEEGEVIIPPQEAADISSRLPAIMAEAKAAAITMPRPDGSLVLRVKIPKKESE